MLLLLYPHIHMTHTAGPISTCHAPLIAPPRGSITGSGSGSGRGSPVNNAPYCVGCRAHVLREGQAFPPAPEAGVAASTSMAAVDEEQGEEEGGGEGKAEAEVDGDGEEEGVQVGVCLIYVGAILL